MTRGAVRRAGLPKLGRGTPLRKTETEKPSEGFHWTRTHLVKDWKVLVAPNCAALYQCSLLRGAEDRKTLHILQMGYATTESA